MNSAICRAADLIDFVHVINLQRHSGPEEVALVISTRTESWTGGFARTEVNVHTYKGVPGQDAIDILERAKILGSRSTGVKGTGEVYANF